MTLLSRDDFRESVFRRDHHKCVVCSSQARDAHHLLERRLWKDGGYYLNNGVSLCAKCHLEAERTNLSCSHLRELAGITETVLPGHFAPDTEYDKWGNPILPNGLRLKGELFHDESVQRILRSLIYRQVFLSQVKYPRTFHLPWSPGKTSDDKTLDSAEQFKGQKVVVTVKMDGENTTLYRNGVHARSVDSRHHSSRDWVRGLQGRIGWEIPEDWRVCGENLFAKHSIFYRRLRSWFLVFSVCLTPNLGMPRAKWSGKDTSRQMSTGCIRR